MVVETDDKNSLIKSLSLKENYQLILTEDCLLLLEMVGVGIGKIAFWSSLFAITYLQLNKLNKYISLYFYDDEKNLEYQLKLKVDNILFLRDSLVKKMRNLRVKVETQKIIKGQQQIKRLTEKEIKEMKINDYTVNTFTTLCGKAIEHFSEIGDDKYMIYVKMMKEVLALEKVNKLTIDDEKELKENAKIK